MNHSLPDNKSPGITKHVPAWITPLLAAACGLIVANLYYSQPLAGPISRSLGIAPGAEGWIVTLTQIGYCLGLIFVVPLGDLVENRRLVVTSLVAAVGALALAAFAGRAPIFLAAALGIGVSSVSAQVLVPYASHFATEETRGQVVGYVMSGLMIGIMLARPVASLIAGWWGWHAVFLLSALAIAVLAVTLWRALPDRRPRASASYGALLGSLWTLWKSTPLLRRRVVYQALLFGSFSVFWTVTPLLLAGPAFQLSQHGIALFALAGVAGAVAAPIAGHLADHGWGRVVTGCGIALSGAGFLLANGAENARAPWAVVGLTAAGIVIDFGVSASLITGQRALFQLGAETRSRLNGIFIALFFLGGATGSALGSWTYEHGGWPLTSWLGAAMPAAALLFFATEFFGFPQGKTGTVSNGSEMQTRLLKPKQ
jgi:predicted MFS family arabinose efflux permease